VTKLVSSSTVQNWSANPANHTNTIFGRATFYDAVPEAGADPKLDEYWRAIELQEDMHLGFGALRGLKRRPRQKGVDVLLAVDMLVGAFGGVFDVAILVAGDADFIPVVEEVKRRGVMVVVAAESKSTAEDLRRAADRYLDIPVPGDPNALLPLAGFARTA
jgi:uncharacterized LabA/DUF88 family protein